MSSSALGPLTAHWHSAQRVVQPVAPRGRASARSSCGPLTARRLIRVRRPAVRRGVCGPGPEPAMRSRRWRSGSVGPPDPGRGCPELVKPILLTDIGVCMWQQGTPKATRACKIPATGGLGEAGDSESPGPEAVTESWAQPPGRAPRRPSQAPKSKAPGPGRGI
jgi:hypothetical protein